jgi:hypothetical protein
MPKAGIGAFVPALLKMSSSSAEAPKGENRPADAIGNVITDPVCKPRTTARYGCYDRPHRHRGTGRNRPLVEATPKAHGEFVNYRKTARLNAIPIVVIVKAAN